MKAVLQFMKTHMITLICGVVGVVAIVLGILGMFQSDVQKELESEKARTSVSQMAGLRSSPKSEEIIARERARGEELKKQFGETVAVARQINKREPLMAGVFPKPERRATPLKFKETYSEEVKKLPGLLGAEELPGPDEIAEEQQNVDEEIQTEKERKEETKVDGDGRTPAVAAEPEAPSGQMAVFAEGGGEGPRSPRGARGGGRGMGMAMASPSAPTTEPRYNAMYRAFVTKAKSIRCYIDSTTFHISAIRDSNDEPRSDEMWYAQVGLWIQEDVCNAIAALNKQFADSVKEGDIFVEQMPVKRLVSVVVNGYVIEGNQVVPFSGASAGDTQQTKATFTGRVSNDLYDVVRYSVSVVVDQRETLRLIDFLTRANFSKCVSVSYQIVDQEAERATGYFYGTAPVIRATMMFETYMLRELFDELKPEEVKTRLSGKKE